MAQTHKPQQPAESDYVVLRAICMAGQRVEVGAVVRMSRSVGTEAMAAGKVALYAGAPAKPPKPAKPGKTLVNQADAGTATQITEEAAS